MYLPDYLPGTVAGFPIALIILTIYLAVKIVPQSQIYVIKRFGKYTRILTAGMSVIVPFLDRVGQRVSILERQLPEFIISMITRDNVEARLETTVF